MRSSMAWTGAPIMSVSDLEMTGDAKPGAIVETRAYEDANGRRRLSLATRSDLPIEPQVTARGRPGSTASSSPRTRRSAEAGSAPRSATQWRRASIISRRKGSPAGKGSAWCSRAI